MFPVFACPAISRWSNLCLHRPSRVGHNQSSSMPDWFWGYWGTHIIYPKQDATKTYKNGLLGSRYRQRGQHKALDAAKQSLQKMWYPGQGQITASVGLKWFFLVVGLAHTDMYTYIYIYICICIYDVYDLLKYYFIFQRYSNNYSNMFSKKNVGRMGESSFWKLQDVGCSDFVELDLLNSLPLSLSI